MIPFTKITDSAAIGRLVFSFVLLLSGCAKRVPVTKPITPPVAAPVPTGGLEPPSPREKAQATSSEPCDPRITRIVALVNQYHILNPCGNQFQAPLPDLPVFGVVLIFPNQDPLTTQNFPAKPGEAGFVYDGGDNVKLIWNDGVHDWMLPMILLGDSQ